MLNTRTLLTEQLRHLLTLNNGRIPLDQLHSLYQGEFGPLSCREVTKYMRRNRVPYFSFHVVNMSSLKWGVWAPLGYPVPLHRRRCTQKMESKTGSSRTGASVPVLLTAANPVPDNVNFDVIREEASDIIDLLDSNLPPFGATLPPCSISSASVLPALVESSEQQESATSLEPKFTNFASTCFETDFDLSHMSSITDVNVELPTETETTLAEQRQNSSCDNDAVLSCAYDFLKDDPALLVEINKKPLDTIFSPMDALDALTEVSSIQRDEETTAGTRICLHNGPPPPKGEDRRDGEGGFGDLGVSVPSSLKTSSSSYGSGSASGSMTFVQKAWDPDQVLDQMQKLKQKSGGILTSDQMDSFLDYFGQHSKHEVDRIEAIETKSIPKKKNSVGEMQKRKRNMAIRFPSCSESGSKPLQQNCSGGETLKQEIGETKVLEFQRDRHM